MRWLLGWSAGLVAGLVALGACGRIDFDPPTGPPPPIDDNASLATGQIIGDGAPHEIEVGFAPDAVVLKCDGSGDAALAATSTMPSGAAKALSQNAARALQAGELVLEATGFTMVRPTRPGVICDWIALRAVPGRIAVGSYTGDSLDDRAITGAGFPPDYAIVIPERPVNARHRLADPGFDGDFDFDAAESVPSDKIQALAADGFVVGTDDSVNLAGATYHYLALRTAPGVFAIGSYTGDGRDDRDLDIVGFAPKLVMVKRRSGAPARPWVYKTAATGVDLDRSLYFAEFDAQEDDLQALRPAGFQVGSFDRVNAAGDRYVWLAFGG